MTSAPILQLEPLNCTSVMARWQPSSDTVSVQGYRLCYHEEDQPEQPTIQLKARTYTYTISGLGKWTLFVATCCGVHCAVRFSEFLL